MANDSRAQGTADNVRRGVKCTHHHTARTFLRTTAAPHSSVSAQGQGDEARGEAPLRSRVRRPRQWLAFDVPRYIRIDRPSKNLNRKVKSLEWDTFLQKRGTIYRRKGRQKGKSHNNGAMPPGGGCFVRVREHSRRERGPCAWLMHAPSFVFSPRATRSQGFLEQWCIESL